MDLSGMRFASFEALRTLKFRRRHGYIPVSTLSYFLAECAFLAVLPIALLEFAGFNYDNWM